MRPGRLVIMGALAVGTGAGCASVIGLDFDAYRQGKVGDSGAALDCIPNQTTRCLCGLDDGFQTCSESGHLSPCVCAPADAAGSAPTCGNGVIETGEVCDDANTQFGDGCNAQCMPDGRPFAVEACPGQDLFLWQGTDVRIDATAFVRSADVDAGSCGVMDPPDRVYAIHSSSNFEIEASSSADFFFSVRTSCADAASAKNCDPVTAGGAPVRRTVEASTGQVHYLVIEPRQVSQIATYSLRIRSL